MVFSLKALSYLFFDVSLLFLCCSCEKKQSPFASMSLLKTQCDPKSNIPSYPYDDLLFMNHIQALGTHNSYHRASPVTSVLEWMYDMPPLIEQLENFGVRQFEFDIVQKKDTPDFFISHLELLDGKSLCETLTECLQEIYCWSVQHPDHVPLMIMLEAKNLYTETEDERTHTFKQLEDTVLNVWDEERLILPKNIQGSFASLKESVESQGWPSLHASRGKTFFLYSDKKIILKEYVRQNAVMFADSKEHDTPYGVVHSITDVFKNKAVIKKFVKKNHIVRTRSDSGGYEAKKQNFARFYEAMESGAQYISTDYPNKSSKFNFVVQMPHADPVRCNTQTSPEFCFYKYLEKKHL